MQINDSDISIALTEDTTTATEQTKIYPLALYYFNMRGYPEILGTGFFLLFESTLFLITAKHLMNSAKNIKKPFGVGFNWSIDMINVDMMFSTGVEGKPDGINEKDLCALVVSKENPNYLDYVKCAVKYNQTMDGRYFDDGITFAYFSGFPTSKNKISTTNVDRSGSTGAFMASYQLKLAEIGKIATMGKNETDFIGLKWVKRIGGNALPHPEGCSGSPLWFVRYDGEKLVQYVSGVFISFPNQHKTLVFTRIEFIFKLLREFNAKWVNH